MTWPGDEWEPGAEPERPSENRSADDMSAGEIDAAFNDLVADWHVDTVKAIRDAEKSLASEDKNWRAALEPAEEAEPEADESAESEQVYLDEFHYVPPPPPPFPRLAAMTVLALLILAASITVLVAGAEMGLAEQSSLLLGVSGVLVAGGIFFTRLRASRDEDDDGTV